jgi:very-short-patch-repair endonuclease
MQLGLASREEVRARGISRFTVYRNIESGKWREIFPGIYLPSPVEPTRDQILLAASEWVQGVISHRAAASRYGLLESSLVELTTARQIRNHRSGVMIHRVGSLDEREVTRIGVIPITTPTCTLIDLGAVVDRPTLRRAAFEGLRLGLTTVPKIEKALAQPSRGRRGVAELRAVLKEGLDTYLERMLKRVLKDSTLPPFACQHRVDFTDGKYYVVDFAYAEKRIAVEADGWAYHSDPLAFESDRKKWRTLASRGWLVLCFTYENVTIRPNEIIATVEAALANRSR